MKILSNQVLPSLHANEKPIVYDVYFEDTVLEKPVVLFCHGYKGFKDWGAWHLVAKSFAKAGFLFVKFNFSHNGGTPEQPIDFPDLEAFAENTYTKELEDVSRMIDFVYQENLFPFPIQVRELHLIGHSRGGGIVLIKAEEDERVTKVATWAGVSDYKARFKEGTAAFENFRKTGRYYVENGRTKQQMPHNWEFYTNFIENEKRLTIQRAAKNLKIPYLIIHGETDTTVPIEEALLLQTWCATSIFKPVSNANHVFGMSHPWLQDILPQHLQEVVQYTQDFFK